MKNNKGTDNNGIVPRVLQHRPNPTPLNHGRKLPINELVQKLRIIFYIFDDDLYYFIVITYGMSRPQKKI